LLRLALLGTTYNGLVDVFFVGRRMPRQIYCPVSTKFGVAPRAARDNLQRFGGCVFVGRRLPRQVMLTTLKIELSYFKDVAMSWNDLRKGRFSCENTIYFITFVVEQRQTFFTDFRSAQQFCQLIAENELDHQCKWLTWVLMPDHFHGLLQISNKSNLSEIIRTLKSKSAIKLNRILKRKGCVWQRAFFDRALRKEDDVKNIARYIVANPLRAKLIDNIRRYPYWDSVFL